MKMGIERVLLEKFSGAASGRSYRSTTFDDPRREDEAAGKGRGGAHSRGAEVNRMSNAMVARGSCEVAESSFGAEQGQEGTGVDWS